MHALYVYVICKVGYLLQGSSASKCYKSQPATGKEFIFSFDQDDPIEVSIYIM